MNNVKYLSKFLIVERPTISLIFILIRLYFLALGKVHGSIHDETKTAQSRKAIIRMLGKWLFCKMI